MKKMSIFLILLLLVSLLAGCSGQKVEKPDTPNVGETAGKVEVPAETPEETEPETEGIFLLTIDPKPMDTISVGDSHIVGLHKDGTVVAVGANMRGECDVAGWTDVVKVRGGYGCTIALRKDGTMLANGYAAKEGDPFYEVLTWTDIVDFDMREGNIAALKSDGTVIGIKNGRNVDYSGWTRVVKVVASANTTVGLRDDGTLLYSGGSGKGYDEELLTSWTNIADIDIHEMGVAAVKTDGTVLAYDKDGQADTSSWQNVKTVCAGEYHLLGIAEDGTVYSNAEFAEGWTDVAAIASDGFFVAAVRSDGTVLTTSEPNTHTGQCATWTNIGIPE